MAEVKTIRAVERALEVIGAIRARRGMSLNELNQATGLPKATLLRILKTLSEGGMVWQRMADGAYVAGALKFTGQPPDITDKLAEIASPFLADLSKRVMWPSVIAAPRMEYIEVIETNGPIVRLDSAVLGPVGLKLSYVHTATGRAYLAACSAMEREAIIERIRPAQADPEGERLLESIVEQTRRQGYSARDPVHFWPDRTYDAVRADGRRSLAVPIYSAGQAIAALNLTWPSSRTTLAEVVELHLATMKATASIIGRRLDEALG
ncbi:helix-turn-helix domain-containing protein [Croceicoccus sediminis]|uniref:helix-turn-helix domain-containing protein n=1 Tax=Croceicoccus sediminis TaxID=2571150 RepID=UPI001F0E68A9|nr:helix-turn-helix domain-containing protein [Croceicoccus sediminis]